MLSKEELLSRNDDETTKLPDSDEQEIQVLDPPSKVPPLLIDLPGFVRTRNGHCSTECNEKEKQQAVFNEKKYDLITVLRSILLKYFFPGTLFNHLFILACLISHLLNLIE
jgi:hypothetical protein